MSNSPLFTVNTGTPSPREKAPRRLPTEPLPQDALKVRFKKRIIVCCDGTWQDGLVVKERWEYTNVLRLARTINHVDERFNPPIPQVVFYQSGVGTENNFYSEYIEGTTGGSLADKVEEAYAFIAHNYVPGDEIFLFGFSRGAYTCRMVAHFIGEIGVLDRRDMDNFAHIFIAYQKLGKSNDKAEIEVLKKQLAPWNRLGQNQACLDQETFSVKCIGVFDTVGSLGLPEELTLHSKHIRTLFGFPDRLLGEHVEQAYQALALNETRADFDCAKFEQTDGGRRKKQVLKQCWFTGCHSDIGGGYQEHDLADMTLTWMAANVGDILALDLKYLASLPQPVAPWGEQKVHNPMTGVFSLAHTIQRQFPTTNDVTHETIHSSVLRQPVFPRLAEELAKHPELVSALMPLEEEMKINWPFKPQDQASKDTYADGKTIAVVTKDIVKAGTKLGQTTLKRVTVKETDVRTEGGEPVYEKNWVGELAQASTRL